MKHKTTTKAEERNKTSKGQNNPQPLVRTQRWVWWACSILSAVTAQFDSLLENGFNSFDYLGILRSVHTVSY